MSLSKLYPLDEHFIPRPLVAPLPVPMEPAAVETSDARDVNAEDTGPAPCDAIEEEAYQRGVNEGILQAQAGIEPTLHALQEATTQLVSLRNQVVEQSRQEMVSLIMAICRKLLHREIAADPAVIGETLREALKLALQADEYHIHLHPDDLAEAERLRPSLLTSLRGVQHLVLHPDPRIGRGGCRVDSNLGEVDATIEAQLAAIEAEIRKHRAEDNTA
ncbi:MAG: hypothetical protein BWK76_00705 [Desulfobulbaceae bacterium A2]|nr:MAG: hypothetical protein BWK76_00705 [Desulfobulbaceae bacterium A2]